MQSDYENTTWVSPASSWLHFLLGNLRLVIFIIVAFAGMIAVYLYFSPEEATAEMIDLSAQSTMSAPIFKSVPQQPVLQRLAQSPGPLRIGIIAGHKGFDSGAVCPDGLTEAEVNDSITRQVVAQLQADGVPVDLLDEFDERLGRYGATAVISIHADSCVYYHDQLTGFKIAGSSYTDSAALNSCLEQSYGEVTQLPYHPTTITEHMTDYHVFREIPLGVPAVIIEVGFLNLDREILTTQSNIPAAGVFSGIQCYLNQVRPNNG
ncbi:MAG: N-acetylmuramoyl-L-alanine amidase [Chloroflexi bacterium]|nr:N-acetylmuramoyl-L-alanine amidase [Chloroflexota bacterium]